MVGAGTISTYHLSAIAALDDVRVATVIARSSGAAYAMAERYGIQNYTDNLLDALKDDGIDAAIVATPDDTHVEIVDVLMRHGVCVMVQKPIATSYRDACALLGRRRPGTADLSVSFMHRFLDETVALKAILLEGILGEIMSVRIRNATPGPDWGSWFFKSNGETDGVVGQLGVHGIDLIEHLFGSIDSVRAIVRQRVPIRTMRDGGLVRSEVPDHAMASYELSNGILVSHEMCWAEVAGTDRFRLEVFGTKGTASVRMPTVGLDVVGSTGAKLSYPIEKEPVQGYRHHRQWVDNVVNGVDSRTAEAATRGLLIAAAIAISSRENTTISTILEI